MDSPCNTIERLQERVRRGELTADQANVEQVRIARVKLVTSRLPADVRKALNSAVKTGYLQRMPKSGRKPEAYYHPNFDYLARAARNDHERKTLEALAGVMARPTL